ncbi:MAG: RNA pseudouridine synthase [Deltaproteobacteria bacterium]|nr:RNA pseudouridine synthase [Deltaproteobacteria bacterium]
MVNKTKSPPPSLETKNRPRPRVVMHKLRVKERTTAVEFLAKKTDLSKTKIKEIMTKGAVWISSSGNQKRLRRATHSLHADSFLSIYYDEEIIELEPKLLEPIFEAQTYSLWIKPSGLICGGSRFGDHCSVNRVIEKQTNKPCFLVHRLDRFASGILALAHSKSAAKAISKQFRERSVDKVYKALVHGRLLKNIKLESPIEGKKSISHVNPICNDQSRTLVRIKIATGRKHQIRRHLSEVGFPIIGDRQYGSDSNINLQLVSVFTGFICPETKKKVSFELPRAYHPSL